VAAYGAFTFGGVPFAGSITVSGEQILPIPDEQQPFWTEITDSEDAGWTDIDNSQNC
jgi:hypothetical protein